MESMSFELLRTIYFGLVCLPGVFFVFFIANQHAEATDPKYRLWLKAGIVWLVLATLILILTATYVLKDLLGLG